MNLPRIAFFGTPQIAVWVLDELKSAGILPALIVTNPDAPKGRKLTLTPSPVAVWAEREGIRTLKPSTLRDAETIQMLKDAECNLFIVAAYGKMLPKEVLDMPKHKVINMHPSLLPRLRGASPIRSAILEDMNPTGVSIMLLTEGMDEGPILAQEEVSIPEDAWPIRGSELDELLSRKGGVLLASVIPEWVAGSLTPKEQEHAEATYSKKITKDMGLIDLEGDAYSNLLKIRAFDGWPGTYFFHTKDGAPVRVKIVDADIENGALIIKRVIPEAKNEMDFEAFLAS